MATSGPSRPSTSIQVDNQDLDADLKSRVVRVAMRGGIWEASDVADTIFTEDAIRNVVSVVPDGVNGCTHTFFLAFPSSAMAEAYMEGWKEGGGWEFALVTDEQLEVFVACAESMTLAVRDGVQVPETSGQAPCTSAVPHGGSGSSEHLENLHSQVEEENADSNSEDDVGDVNALEDATFASLRGPTGRGSRPSTPPSKTRRVSVGGSSIGNGSGPGLQSPSVADVRDWTERLTRDFLRQWLPNERSTRPSAKALGKRPES
ncbi:hypothetical protein FRC05_009084 [Tulasnella sp. 425]|nr:hypothetical protein FRC05_009084 [Tulasnella sp. 425]